MRVFEPEQGQPQPFDLLITQAAALDASHALPFKQLAQEFNDAQHKLRQIAFDLLRVGCDALRQLRVLESVVLALRARILDLG